MYFKVKVNSSEVVPTPVNLRDNKVIVLAIGLRGGHHLGT